MINKLFVRIKSISLRNKIFICYAFLILFASWMIQSFSVNLLRDSLEAQISSSVLSIADNIANRVDDRFIDIRQKALIFARDSSLSDVLKDYVTLSALEKYDKWRMLYNTIKRWEMDESVISVRMYFDQSLLFLRDGITFFENTEPLDSIIDELRSSPNVLLRRGVGNTLNAFCPIYDTTFMYKIAVLEVVFDITDVVDLMSITNNSSIQNIALTDGENILYGNQASKVSEDNSIVINKKLPNANLTLAIYLPSDYISNQTDRIIWQTNTACIVFLTIAFIIAWLISAGITRRLNLLSQAMLRLESGVINQPIPQDAQDELGRIIVGFNHLCKQLSITTEQIFHEQLSRKEAQFRLLQAQINPHFLYNTLDVISRTAASGSSADVEWLVSQLSDFLRSSIMRGEEHSTVVDALKQVQAYWNIQNYRYSDRIFIDLNVEQAVLNEPILPMIIQPLVENSLQHGILARPEKCGLVTVDIFKNGSYVVLKVSDDGVGLSPEKLQKVSESLKDTTQSTDHYGLWNVRQRLLNRYGDKCSLTLESHEGEGFCCTLSWLSE